MSEAPEDAAANRAETAAVRERYARRAPGDDRYRLTNPAALMAMQERQRAVLRLFARRGFADLGVLRLLEVGSGGGGNLLELLQLGFQPQHLAGVELLPERHAAARARLPEAVQLTCGDASALPLAAASVDIVLVSTVFSSLLDDAFQQRLAGAIWRWVKPGGGVLWYDFTVDNPNNSGGGHREPARHPGAAARPCGLPRSPRPLHSVQRLAAAAHAPALLARQARLTPCPTPDPSCPSPSPRSATPRSPR